MPREHRTPGRPAHLLARGPLGSRMWALPWRVGSHGIVLRMFWAMIGSMAVVFPAPVAPTTSAWLEGLTRSSRWTLSG